MPAQNTSVLIAIVASTIMLLLLAGFIVTFLLFFQRRQQRNRLEKHQLQSQFAETLLQSQLEIRERTLQHIASELHDNLGQVASLIKINLTTLNLEDKISALQKVKDTRELICQLITDIKSMSLNLNSDRIIQAGLQAAIQKEVERLNKTGRFQASLQVEGTVPVLDANKTVILFRVVQEVLHNAMKHSEAQRITVSLYASEKLFKLVCSDDGIGFDLEERLYSGGAGLINLQNRARLIDAQLNILSSAEKGTAVSIEIPI